MLKPLKKCPKRLIFNFFACHLQIDVDPDSVPDPAYHFDADPEADPDTDFYLKRIRMRIRIFI
jgi:hypothetical protein